MNKIHILDLGKGVFVGELVLDDRPVASTGKYLNSVNCAKALNKKIAEYELLKDLKLPRLKVTGETVYFLLTDGKAVLTKAPPKPEPEPEAEPKPPANPKRKPFTPYGLNGYFVDKNGNVRLMLDRKANAHTIVLTAEMFAALSEMVKMTQEQTQPAHTTLQS